MTLILGASQNPERYSYKAAQRLLRAGEEFALIGGREGELFGIKIHVGKPNLKGVDTVTVYLNQERQENYIDYLVTTIRPKRIILNPGAENLSLAIEAKKEGIEVVHACTLVLLAMGQYLPH